MIVVSLSQHVARCFHGLRKLIKGQIKLVDLVVSVLIVVHDVVLLHGLLGDSLLLFVPEPHNV